jgi:hypothetical protein
MAGERIEGRHIVLMAFDAGNGIPWPVPCAVCGICSALVAVEPDGEMRHLVAHEHAAQLGDDWSSEMTHAIWNDARRPRPSGRGVQRR